MKFVFALACIIFSATALWTGKQEAVPGKIDGQYIVVFKNSVSAMDRDAHHAAFAGNLTVIAHHSIGSSFQAYSAKISASMVPAIEKSGAVAYVEQDGIATITQSTCATQEGLPAGLWGLTRIHQRTLNLNGVYTYHQVTPNTVRAYVLDTGVLTTHVEFAGNRAVIGANFVDTVEMDQNGHGTHVASTIAGRNYGVSKTATIVAVKVLGKNGSGSWTGVIQGVQWTTTDAIKYRGVDPAVANMSLGGGRNQALNDAVLASVNEGSVTWVIASGNSNADACNFSPASACSDAPAGGVPHCLAVGSTSNTDARSSFSNFGRCQQVWAPGQNILGAWFTSNTATNTISGTSMAAPHAAGVACNVLSVHPASPPREPRWVAQQIIATATKGAVRDGKEANGTPNELVYDRCGN